MNGIYKIFLNLDRNQELKSFMNQILNTLDILYGKHNMCVKPQR